MAFVAAMVTTSAMAQKATPPRLANYPKTPVELAAILPTGDAGGSGNAKAKVATVQGDPSEPGQLLKFTPATAIAAHDHAGDCLGAGLQGTWMFGYGSSSDKAAMRMLSGGSICIEPPGGAHFALTCDEALAILIAGFRRDPESRPECQPGCCTR